MSKNTKYIIIKNKSKKIFLDQHKCYPEYEEYENAYYKATPALTSLLEQYAIRFRCFPNRLQ